MRACLLSDELAHPYGARDQAGHLRNHPSLTFPRFVELILVVALEWCGELPDLPGQDDGQLALRDERDW